MLPHPLILSLLLVSRQLTREVRRVSMPILNGLERVGHNAPRPAHAAWQNGVPKPVAGIYEVV